MADRLGLGNEIRELKIGQSFTNPKSKAFHTLKYDFKPASVDTSKKANVEVPGVNQVTVTVPHLDGAGIPQTVFKGSQKPYTKECVLIIDKVTGEITIEKLNCNIQVKKTYEYSNKPKASKADKLNQSKNKSGSTSSKGLPLRSQTPPALVGHRVSNKTKVTSGSRRADRQITQLVPKHHSPLQASPTYPSPGNHVKSPRRDFHTSANESHNQSTLASLPMIGIDDFSDPRPASRNAQNPRPQPPPPLQQQQQQPRPPTAADKWPKTGDDDDGAAVGEISDTSSYSSDSDSDDSDASTGGKNTTLRANNGAGAGAPPVKIDTRLLNDDLRLSESGSDSD